MCMTRFDTHEKKNTSIPEHTMRVTCDTPSDVLIRKLNVLKKRMSEMKDITPKDMQRMTLAFIQDLEAKRYESLSG